MADEKITVDKDLLTDILDAYFSPLGFGRLKKGIKKLRKVVEETEANTLPEKR